MIERLLSRSNPDELGMRKEDSGEVKFRFDRTDFGSVAPKISNVKAHKDEEKAIIVDFDVSYLGDCDLQVSLLGAKSGIR